MNVLKEFNSEVFPKKTKAACFYCCHSFTTQPLPIPYEYKNNIFHVKYNFCSWECMKTYNNESNVSDKEYIFTIIQLFYKSLSNGKCTNIGFAPNRLLLKQFGGSMTIQDFRKSNLNTSYIVFEKPLILNNPVVDKVDNFAWINKEEAKETMDNFNKTVKTNLNNNTNDAVKLKRNKPANKDQNTLEISMGLFRK